MKLIGLQGAAKSAAAIAVVVFFLSMFWSQELERNTSCPWTSGARVEPVVSNRSSAPTGGQGQGGGGVALSVTSSLPPSSSPPAEVTPEMRIMCVEERTAGLGSKLHVHIENLDQAVTQQALDPHKFVLYLNDRPLWNVRNTVGDVHSGRLEFVLERADTSRGAWVLLLGKAKGRYLGDTRVGVAYEAQPPLRAVDAATRPPLVRFVVFDTWRLWAGAFILFALLFAFLVLAKESDIIRDSAPPQPESGTRRPYSLARLQMAIWFFLIMASFVFVWVLTGEISPVSEQALILMGIGTGTALGAATLDASKRSTSDQALTELMPKHERLKAEAEASRASIEAMKAAQPAPDPAALAALEIALAEKQEILTQQQHAIDQALAARSKPVSEGFVLDILTDATGVSFHRFQMLAWTCVLGLFFVHSVYERLAMPEFSPTMLALLGISAGTYLGFKIPERQAAS